MQEPGDTRAQELGEAPAQELSEARLRQLVAHLPFFAVLIDRDHRYEWVHLDPTLERTSILGRTAESFLHRDCRAEVFEAIERAFSTGQHGYYEARPAASNEEHEWYGVRIVALPPDADGCQHALLLSTDITQRRNAEAALRESEARFRMLTEASPDFVIILDSERRCEYVNRDPPDPNTTRENMVGRRIDEFVRREDHALVVHSVQSVLDTGCVASFDTSGFYSDRAYQCRVLPLPGVGDRPHAMLVMTDVSEQRAADEHRRALEAQLMQAQKLESIGLLAGGIAHDFNNMIMVMGLHLEAARDFERAGDREQTRRELDEIERAAKRAADLTRQLLAFARRQPHSPRPALAADFTAAAVRLLRRLIPASIHLELDIAAPDAWVMADPGMLEQVIMNLCVNSRDAIGDARGTIRIRLARCTIPDGPTERVPPGAYVTLAVADTGHGIAAADTPRVFEPFYTTKAQGQGTGLGLSMVHGIVTQHQGFVTVDSELGKGAVFTIYLPEIAESRRSEPPPALDRPEPARGRILVAEDEPMVRRLVGNLLRRAGHAVLEAENGAHALRVLSASTEPFDLMVLDAVMPEMGGKECYERAQELQPGLPAIFSSGYSGDMLPSDFLRDHDLPLIRKPYDSQTLLDAVDGLLQRRRAS
ncbi:MAG TPA: ATP-binding protein [Polyangiales bacterium]|nr:ATP-binding protein [Polyangiales bacterium]